MDVINRSAVIVMPAEPFLKWLHRADSTSAELSTPPTWIHPAIYWTASDGVMTVQVEQRFFGHYEVWETCRAATHRVTAGDMP
jgi:hypothetical protein